MTGLEHLPQIAEKSLGGLKADARLLGQIKLAAAREPQRRVRWQPMMAGAAALALCVFLGVWVLPTALDPWLKDRQPSNEVLSSGAAGGEVGQGESLWVRAMQANGGVSVSGAADAPATYRNLFSPERSGNFPLVLINGAAYRMLISPTNMKDGLLGKSIGEVTEYTLEPALSTGDGVVSNIVSAGETIYAVQGLEGSMIAAYVKGGLRAFQRVSFAGASLLGSETLADTLAGAAHVTAMELTDGGIIDDAAAAQALMQVLLDNAVYESAAVGSGDTRSLLIALDNGLLMQLMVGDDTVSACGTWSCPEFFEAYAAAIQ